MSRFSENVEKSLEDKNNSSLYQQNPADISIYKILPESFKVQWYLGIEYFISGVEEFKNFVHLSALGVGAIYSRHGSA